MYLDKNAILDNLTKEEVTKVVMSLGSAEPKEDSQGNLIFQTICHNVPSVDNSYKLYYYHEPDEVKGYKGRTFKCYSGCGGECFSLTELVIRAKRNQGINFNWYKALYYIGQITGKLIAKDPTESEQKDLISDFQWIDKFINLKNKKSNAIPELKEISENVLDVFVPYHHEEFLNSGINHEAMNRFEIGYYQPENQITIPQRDLNGRLIGVRVRNLTFETEAKPKYCPAKIEGKVLSHPTGSVLYGAWVTKDKIKECGKALLAEGEKSCLLAYTYFGEDSYCVAATGSAITLTQQKILIKELGIHELIYMPDKDYKEAHDSFAAESWFQKQIKQVKPFVQVCKVYIIVDDIDVLDYKANALDAGLDTFLTLYDHKVEITMADYFED